MNEWLLDTGVLLWWLAADPRLSFIVRTRITQSATRVFVSVATAWEVASLARQGRLDLGEPPEICLTREVALHRFLWLPLEARHVLRAQALPRGTSYGRDGRGALDPYDQRVALDPYDRLLVAQAALEGLSIVTTNIGMAGHGVAIVEALERSVPARAKRPRLGRPVRRSGDDLAGEEAADPAEPRTLENPSGAPGPDCEPGPRAGEAPESWADESREPAYAPGPDRAPVSGWAPGPGGAAGPGGAPGQQGAAPDIVSLRPIPRWNAFPWGGTFGGSAERGGGGDREEPQKSGQQGEYGEPGAPGERGEPGAPGERGERGAPGEHGERGERGTR